MELSLIPYPTSNYTRCFWGICPKLPPKRGTVYILSKILTCTNNSFQAFWTVNLVLTSCFGPIPRRGVPSASVDMLIAWYHTDSVLIPAGPSAGRGPAPALVRVIMRKGP